ncbi:hypothetical protein PyrSV_gp03 [Pyrobaculum spherical virus]|uniref:Uncharacterized protein n=1 Tax=Pyrobaculum spherical virus (isolate United States/Yellowstone) TaxID=654907 RepID=Q6ZYK0_PSVY|nr:hypothetical protein PyrSV_gp03 [Pyrobaculum spherical virus]CAG25622.1 hypothetical protein [Pyrobaculum spherical virus]
MDFVRLVTATVYAYFIVSSIFGVTNIWVDIALYLILLVSVVYATEVNMALSNARVWYNVMVVSVAMALPQTVFAVNLAVSGKPLAAWIDTLGSTLVDAIFVTAVVRRHVVGSPLVRSPLVVFFLFAWSILAVGLNIMAWHPELYTSTHFPLFYAIAGLLLPIILVRGNVHGLPSGRDMLMLTNNAFATLVASYMLSEAVAQLHIEEVQLGVVSTVLATLPDFIVGMLIRSVVSEILSSQAGDQEMVFTMLAAAVHDQLTIPGLIMLLAPYAMGYYPHLFNIVVVLLKFTLLDRRLFWFVGVPGGLLALVAPPV